MKKLASKFPCTSLPTVDVHELADTDQTVLAFLEEHFPELDPAHFLRWSRVALNELWEAQRRVVN